MLKIQPPELAGLTFTECRDRIRAWFQQPASMPDGVIDFIVIEVALKDWAAPGGSPADLVDHGPKEWALSFMRRGLSRSPDGPRSPVADLVVATTVGIVGVAGSGTSALGACSPPPEW